MEMIPVDLGDESYNINIGAGLLSHPEFLDSQIMGHQIFVVSNQKVADFYLDRLCNGLESYQIDFFLMPDGEQFKTLESFETIIGRLVEKGHKRSTTIVALGGGVVGDTAGYVAASYQRGVSLIQVPTTLLSQVDSSVGGKTGVNHPLGKNMIGAFHQPRAVLIDTDTLASLPERELSAGLAEAIKHGVLADAGYFEYIESRIGQLRKLDNSSLVAAIKGSCQIKARIVAADEKESGQRALLNFGHTFGHAIETAFGYGEWLHGEAVGAGIVMAADLSMRLGLCCQDDAKRVKRLVESSGLPTEPPSFISADEFLVFMSKDKKATDLGLRFVLMDGGIGRSKLVDGVDQAILRETLGAGRLLCE